MGTYWPQLLGARILNDSDRSAAGDIDADVVDWVKTNKFILACAIGYDNKDTAASFYKVYWRNVTDSGSFAEITGTGQIKLAATSGVLTDNATLTSTNRRAGDYSVTPGMTWQDGYEDVGDNRCPDSPTTLNLEDDCWSELQFVFDCSDAHDGDEYEFQLYNGTLGAATGTLLCTLTIWQPIKTKTYSIDMLLATRTAKTYDIDMRLATRHTTAYDIDAILQAEAAPAGSKQIISGGYYDNLSTAGSEYQMPQGGTTWGTPESSYAVPWPCAGKITEFGFSVQTGIISAGSYTATLRKNSAATELAVTVDSGTSEGVDTGEVTVAAGDLICIQSTPSGATGTPYACWYIVFEPTNVGDTVMLGLAQRDGNTPHYAPFYVNAPYTLPTSDLFQTHSLIATPGVLSNFYAKTSASTDGSNYLTFTVYKNATVTDLAAVCSDANYPDTTDTVTLADQDRIQVRIAMSGSVTGGLLMWSAVFHPDTHGEWLLCGSTSDDPATTGAEYNALNGQYYTSVWDNQEPRYWHLFGACTLKKIRVQVATAPGSGKSRTFTVRRVATSDLETTVTLSDSETDDAYSADSAITQLMKLTLKHDSSGTPTASGGQRWAVVGYIAPTGGGAMTKTYDIDMRLAARTDKTYDVDALLATRQTKTYDIDARVATRQEKTYDADVLLRARREATYDVDARLASRQEATYDIDMRAASRGEATYDIDALLRKRSDVPYDIDVLVAERKATSYDIDAYLRSRYEQTYDIDVLLRLRQEIAYDIDALLRARHEASYDIDARLAQRLEAAYAIDVILEVEGATKYKPYDIDMYLATRQTSAYDIDALLAQRLTTTYDIDVYLRARREATYDIDALLAARKTASYDADALVALRQEAAYDIDTRLAGRNEVGYDIDTYLRLRQTATYDVDARVADRKEVAYAIDVILALAGAGVIAAIDGIPWANVAKVCGIPKAQIAKVNGWSTS